MLHNQLEMSLPLPANLGVDIGQPGIRKQNSEKLELPMQCFVQTSLRIL